MDTVDIFRENLRRITDAKKPRQSKIADDCGIARSEMNDFLQGRKRFGMDRLEKIANYLNIPIAKMISSAGSDEANPGRILKCCPTD
jgi:transcriptional regulator with XRE-family HTH domain